MQCTNIREKCQKQLYHSSVPFTMIYGKGKSLGMMPAKVFKKILPVFKSANDSSMP